MRILIGGASGFLGSALTDRLTVDGHQVTRLVRRPALNSAEATWDPSTGSVDQALVDQADAVINLSGAPVAKWPRTRKVRDELLASRLGPTTTLASAIAAAPQPPVFLSASGMSWYGVDRGSDLLDETAEPGDGFLADVSQRWEAATKPAADAGARTVLLRTSMVLHRDGGALKAMLPAWKAGGGARFGKGEQRMSVISRDDWVAAVVHVLDRDVSGPVNLAMPNSVSNAEFTKGLAHAVNRPAFMVAPRFAVKAALGGVAEDLLGSLDLVPSVLEDSGFTFTHPDLPSALEAGLR